MTLPDARQILDQFCAKLSRRDDAEESCPVFMCTDEPGAEVRACVYLPSSLPPGVRTAQSRSLWRTEKKAKQDAAFQICRALHGAGFLTDYLLPIEAAIDSDLPEDDTIETRESLYDVQFQYDPWPTVMSLWASGDQALCYKHPLTVEGSGISYPRMLILRKSFLRFRRSCWGWYYPSQDS
jgi:hypothetical protein